MMIRNALDAGAVDTLLISESVRKSRVSLKCSACGNEWEASIGNLDENPDCPSCESNKVTELSRLSLVDDFIEIAQKTNAQIKFVSVDTEEGAQLSEGFAGLAALLRYPIM